MEATVKPFTNPASIAHLSGKTVTVMSVISGVAKVMFAGDVFKIADYLLELPVIKHGVCVSAAGYAFTEGKTYPIHELNEPENLAPGFTWPAYASVTDDNGKLCFCHADRFKFD